MRKDKVKMCNGVVVPSEIQLSIIYSNRLFDVSLVPSPITIHEYVTIPIVKVHILVDITRENLLHVVFSL